MQLKTNPEIFKNQLVSQLDKLINQVLKELDLPKVEFIIEHPAQEEHGDWSTNIALVLAQKQAQKPRDLAEQIKEKLNQQMKAQDSELFKRLEVAGPGFINFYLKPAWLIKQLDQITQQKDSYGHNQSLKAKKVMLEFTDPNPFKEFHIGHLYSNLIGESLSRIFEANGAQVWRSDFYGDVGMHVAKSVWGMMQKMDQEKITLADLEKKSIKQRQRFLGQGYTLGVDKYEKSEAVKKEIKDLNYLIYVANQEYRKREKDWQPLIDYAQYIKVEPQKLKQVQPVYEAGLKWSLAYFETIYQRLGTKFDGYYPESWVGELGMKLVEKGLKQGVLSKSQGAVVYQGEQDGLHTRVFVNKLGLPTYETKDLGLAQAKYEDFKYDRSINIFGQEIDEYYKVVKAALVKIEPELGQKAEHLAHGMVNLPEGKMSSRTGNVITCEWLLDETKAQVLKIMKPGLKNKDQVAETVAQGAVKYAFLKSNIGSNITFDLNSSVSFEGNSGPYLQYTYARAQSVLKKSPAASHQPLATSHPLASEELALLRYFYRFPEVVFQAVQELAPDQICHYLYELAQRYNVFYNQCRIIGDKKETLRLSLTKATAQILKNGLKLLGIKAPEKM